MDQMEDDKSYGYKDILKDHAWKFIILLGLVSLFADMTYEGARSITGPYLSILGASAVVVGFVSGLGELVRYGLRFASGYLSDRTRRYWSITIIGYTVNLLPVPLLALAGSWEMAAVLLIAERLGKAIRTPARDIMLSHATLQLVMDGDSASTRQWTRWVQYLGLYWWRPSCTLLETIR